MQRRLAKKATMMLGVIEEAHNEGGHDEECHNEGGHDDPSRVAVERIYLMKSPSWPE